MLNYFSSFADELTKIATSGRVQDFLSGAHEEIGPAAGATLGAGLAKAYGYSPVTGSALGYGVGSLPNLVATALKKKVAFTKSQYSGPLSYGPFKQESHIPPFVSPPVKTAAPPAERMKTAAQQQGMAPTGTQTMGPQIQYSPTKQLNSSRSVAKVDTTKPSSKSALKWNVQLPEVGSPL